MTHQTSTLKKVNAFIDSNQWGVFLVLFASVGFGLNPLFARWAYGAGLQPESALFYRFMIPALVMAPALKGIQQHWRTAVIGLALGVFVAIGTLTYFRAIAVVPVATAAVVYFTHPLFAMLLGRILYREQLTRTTLAAGLLILVASGLILSPSGLSSSQLSALALSFLMPISFAAVMVGFAHWLNPLKVPQRTAVILWGQVLIIVPVIWWLPQPQLVPQTTLGWISIAGLATISSLLPQLSLSYGIPRVGATRSAIFGTFELITSLLVGWVILSEPIRLIELVGAGLLLWAMIMNRPRAVETLEPQ